MTRKCDTTKHRKLSKKQRANKRKKKQQQVTQQVEQKILADNGLPEPALGAMERLAQATKPEPDVCPPHFWNDEGQCKICGVMKEPKPISPARRAFQDI